MQGEWQEKTWGELATLEYGKALRGYQEATGPYRVYGTNGPIGWHDTPLCPFPSVIIGRKGAYRGIYFSPEPFFVIDTAFYLNPKTDFDIKWAYYELLTHDINSMDSGSAIPSTSRESFYALRVLVPPKDEQRAIAHILGTLDDKIELNRRMNETLEAMAQTLFKSWFVDFDPVVVNALRAGNPIPQKFAKRAAYYRNILRQKHAPLPRGEGLGVREKLPPKLLAYARALRKNQTDAERLMWRLLRNRQFLGIKFRRQHPIEPYIVDFYAHELGLVIEIDGGHHAEPKQKAYDEKRTAFLQEKGLMVIRYWANDVLNETEAVLKDLYQRVVERKKQFPSPPAPLPGGEGSIFPEHILRLFPDRFVDSELGPIPEGWEVKALPELAEIVLGGTPNTSMEEYWHGDILWASAKDISNTSDVFIIKTERTITRLGLENSNAKLLPAGTTVITSRGTVGKFCMLGVDMAINQTNYGLVPHPHVDRYYLYLCIANIISDLKQRSYGTIFETITTKTLKGIKVIFPEKNIINSFGIIISPLMEKILTNISEADYLAGLRDTLLPKLISGELRVPDVEQILEAIE